MKWFIFFFLYGTLLSRNKVLGIFFFHLFISSNYIFQILNHYIFKSPKVITFGNILIWNLSNLYNLEWNYSLLFPYKIHSFFCLVLFFSYDYYSLTYHYPFLIFILKNLSNFNLRDYYYYLLENILDHNLVIFN